MDQLSINRVERILVNTNITIKDIINIIYTSVL